MRFLLPLFLVAYAVLGDKAEDKVTYVHPVDDKTLDKFVEDNDQTFVLFYMSKCAHFQKAVPEVAGLAVQMMEAKEPFKFAMLNLADNPVSRKKYKVTGSPTIILLGKDRKPRVYSGPRKTQAMKKWLIRKKRQLVSVIDTKAQVEELIQTEELLLLASVAGDKTKDAWKLLVGAVKKVAEMYDDYVSFAVATVEVAKEMGMADRSLYLFSKESPKKAIAQFKLPESKEVETFDMEKVLDQFKQLSRANKGVEAVFLEKLKSMKAMDPKGLSTLVYTKMIQMFIMKNAFKDIVELKEDNYGFLQKVGRPLVLTSFDYKAKDFEKLLKTYKDVAMGYTGLSFTYVDFDAQKKMLKNLGLNKVGEVMIMNWPTQENVSVKFKMDALYSDKQLITFLESFKKNNVKPFLKSAPLPMANDLKGPVLPAVAANFADQLNDKVPDVVLYYANWCVHSQKFLPIYEALGELFAPMIKDKKIRFFKYDLAENDSTEVVRSYPTIKLYIPDADAMTFSGSRSPMLIAKWIVKKLELPVDEKFWKAIEALKFEVSVESSGKKTLESIGADEEGIIDKAKRKLLAEQKKIKEMQKAQEQEIILQEPIEKPKAEMRRMDEESKKAEIVKEEIMEKADPAVIKDKVEL